MLERHTELVYWCQYLSEILEAFTSTTNQLLNFQLNLNLGLGIPSTPNAMFIQPCLGYRRYIH